MTATWHTPLTWQVGQLVTAADLNEQVRNNLDFLKSPPTTLYTGDEAANYTTTSTSFVDVHATNFGATLTTAGGAVLIVFCGSVSNSGLGRVHFDLLVDGVRRGGNEGLIGLKEWTAGDVQSITLVHLITGLSAASHTIKLQWKVTAGTETLYAADGSGIDIKCQFWAREI